MTNDARAVLIARQGQGARYDAANAPSHALALVRSGTAYFNRLLNGLSDAALDAPPSGQDLSRRMIVSSVGYHARTLAEFSSAACQAPGTTLETLADPDPTEIAYGATLPARALRHLISHTCVHLNVVWRDMKDDQWGLICVGRNQITVILRDMPAKRAVFLWQNVLDLKAGGRMRDVPEILKASLGDKGAMHPGVLEF